MAKSVMNGVVLECQNPPSQVVNGKTIQSPKHTLNGVGAFGHTINGFSYPPAPAGSVLYYPGLPGQGATIWDRSNAGNNGTIVGATWTKTNAGLWYLDFATNDYITITGALTASLASLTAGTFLFWVNPDSATPAGHEYLICFGDTNANEFLGIYIEQTTGLFRVNCVVAGSVKWTLQTDASPFTTGKWTQVGITHNATAPILYANGVAVAQTFTTETDKTVWFSGMAGLDNGYIGCRDKNNSGRELFANCGMDLWRGTTTAMSAPQILNSYREERHLFGV